MSHGGVAGFRSARARELRQRAELTQAELAAAIGVSRTAVIAWEGRIAAPTPRNLVELARVLRVRPAELVDVVDSQACLADLRAWAGLRQVDVAERLGVGETTYVEVERGLRDVPEAWVTPLAAMFTVDVATLRAASARRGRR